MEGEVPSSHVVVTAPLPMVSKGHGTAAVPETQQLISSDASEWGTGQLP